jgi:hypothetical protein
MRPHLALAVLSSWLAAAPAHAIPLQFGFTGTVTSNLNVAGAPVGSTVSGFFSYDSDAPGFGTSLSYQYPFLDSSPPYGIVASFESFTVVGSAAGAAMNGDPTSPGGYVIRVQNGTFSDSITVSSSIEHLGLAWGDLFTGFRLTLRAPSSLLPAPILPTSLSLDDLSSAVLTITALREELVRGQPTSVALWEVTASLSTLAGEPFTPLPEPGFPTALGLALLALAGSRRREKPDQRSR